MYAVRAQGIGTRADRKTVNELLVSPHCTSIHHRVSLPDFSFIPFTYVSFFNCSVRFISLTNSFLIVIAYGAWCRV